MEGIRKNNARVFSAINPTCR